MPSKKRGKARRLTREEIRQRREAAAEIAAHKAANTVVVEVKTMEQVERTYTVEVDRSELAKNIAIPKSQLTDEEIRVEAEERVTSGEDVPFIQGNADIEEVLSVKFRED